MARLTEKDWLIIVVGAIVTYFAPTAIQRILGALPNFINWVINNIVLVGIIALIVYSTKK